jgi:hypothetical protein
MERNIEAGKILMILLLKILMPFPEKNGIIFSAHHNLTDTYF